MTRNPNTRISDIETNGAVPKETASPLAFLLGALTTCVALVWAVIVRLFFR